MKSISQHDYPVKAKLAYDTAVADLQANGTALFALSPQALDHALAQTPRPSHGDRWGCWTLDAKHLTLDFLPEDNRPGSGWYVDLGKLTSAQRVYETILQVRAKRYIGAEDLGNFVVALHDLGLTINFNRPTPFDTVAHLKSPNSRRFERRESA